MFCFKYCESNITLHGKYDERIYADSSSPKNVNENPENWRISSIKVFLIKEARTINYSAFVSTIIVFREVQHHVKY